MPAVQLAYYREWALILDGWSRTDESGIALAQRGIDNLKSEGSFARMPYWLSLLADLSVRNGRPDAARATLDAALIAGHAYDDMWWLPEVMRMRAAHDEAEAASRGCVRPRRWRRLRAVSCCSGAASATSPSEALGRRFAGVLPGSLRRAHGRERYANGAGPSFVMPRSQGAAKRRGTHMTTTSADLATEAFEQLAGACAAS